MRKSKRFLAVLTAAAMTLSFGAIQTFAEGEDIIGVGDVLYIDGDGDSGLLVDLPTNLAWNFLVDPQGLSALKVGDLFDEDDLGKSTASIQRPKADGSGYETVTVDMSPTLVFKNASAAVISNSTDTEVNVTASALGTGDAVFVGKTAVEVEDVVEDDVVKTPAPNNIFIQLVASTKDIGAADFNDEEFSGTIGRAIADGDTPTEIDLLIDKSQYVYEVKALEPFTTDYRLLNEDEVHGTILVPDGNMNPYADWSDFVPEYNEDGTVKTPAVKKVGITVEFAAEVSTAGKTVTESAGTGENQTLAAAYGLINTDSSTDNITNAAITKPLAPAVPEAGFASDTGVGSAGVWTYFDFGLGESTIKQVTSNGSLITKGSAWEFNADTNKIGFKMTAGTKSIVVTMNDSTKHKLTLTVS